MNSIGRPVQYFSDEYLEYCKQLTSDQITQFIEEFRIMFAARRSEDNHESSCLFRDNAEEKP